MKEDELKLLLSRLVSLSTENETVEFKVNNLKPTDIGERISALSNSAALVGQPYGYLVFGIEDNTHAIVGTTFKPENEKIEREELEHWLIQRLMPRLDFRIYKFEIDSKAIVLFQIPAAQGQPVSFFHQNYIRIGSITRSLKAFPEKERKLWLKPSSDFELEIAKPHVSASEVVALLDTQSVFDLLLKIPYPTTQSRVIEKLIDEKLVVRSNGHFNISYLGALLFAKSLKNFDLDRRAPRVIKYKGVGKLFTEKDQFGSIGYGNGFERMMIYIYGLLPSYEVIESAKRIERTTFPPLAVRELVANAIIHQDLTEKGTFTSIEIYDDRIEITNPGIPTVEPNRFIDSSETRNALMAKAMRKMGFCEEKGSGIDKVVYECEAYKLPPPDFRVEKNQTKAILFAYKEFNKLDRNDKIRATYQHCCLLYVSNQKMTNQTIRNRFNLDEKNASSASRVIKETIKEGLIRPEDPNSASKKFQSYIPYWA